MYVLRGVQKWLDSERTFSGLQLAALDAFFNVAQDLLDCWYHVRPTVLHSQPQCLAIACATPPYTDCAQWNVSHLSFCHNSIRCSPIFEIVTDTLCSQFATKAFLCFRLQFGEKVGTGGRNAEGYWKLSYSLAYITRSGVATVWGVMGYLMIPYA